MAYGIVPNLQDPRVLCQSLCAHRDCKATREEWEEVKCVLCRQDMQIGQRFYNYMSGKVHAVCLEQAQGQ